MSIAFMANYLSISQVHNPDLGTLDVEEKMYLQK